jgi:hypothetical protein
MRWAVAIHESDVATLGALRAVDGVEVGRRDGVLWLRGATSDESINLELRKLPSMERYEILDNNRLRPSRSLIVSETLPELSWKPLRQWLQLEMPEAVYSGVPTGRVSLVLRRAASEQEAGILLVNLRDWAAYAVRAPLIRLRHLVYAVNGRGQALVRGKPLPSLPGEQFVDHGGLAVPVGFHWSPSVDVEVVKQAFGIGDNQLVLWRADGSLSSIAREQLVPVTRSGVRLTMEAFSP